MPCAAKVRRECDPNGMEAAENERKKLRAERRYYDECEESLKYAKAQVRANNKKAKRNKKRGKDVADAENAFVDTLDSVSPEEKATKAKSIDVKVSLPKELFPFVPEENGERSNVIWEVKCPTCSKPLTTREGAPYYRCPSCGKVFGIRKTEKKTID